MNSSPNSEAKNLTFQPSVPHLIPETARDPWEPTEFTEIGKRFAKTRKRFTEKVKGVTKIANPGELGKHRQIARRRSAAATHGVDGDRKTVPPWIRRRDQKIFSRFGTPFALSLYDRFRWVACPTPAQSSSKKAAAMCESIGSPSDNMFRFKSRFVLAAAAVALCWMSASPLKAEIVFENDFSTSQGIGAIVNSGTNFATGFVTGPSSLMVQFDKASLILSKAGATDVTPIIELRADNAGNPGSVLATLSLSGPAISSFDEATYDFTGSFTFSPSTTYWLSLDAPVGQAFTWFFVGQQPSEQNSSLWSTVSPPIARRSTDGGINWSSSGAAVAAQLGSVRIEAVPEPPTFVMAGLAGFVGLAVLRRRRGVAVGRPAKA